MREYIAGCKLRLVANLHGSQQLGLGPHSPRLRVRRNSYCDLKIDATPAFGQTRGTDGGTFYLIKVNS